MRVDKGKQIEGIGGVLRKAVPALHQSGGDLAEAATTRGDGAKCGAGDFNCGGGGNTSGSSDGQCGGGLKVEI